MISTKTYYIIFVSILSNDNEIKQINYKIDGIDKEDAQDERENKVDLLEKKYSAMRGLKEVKDFNVDWFAL